jgi:hypothetical protein
MRYAFVLLFFLSSFAIFAQRSRDYALSIGSQYSGEAINAFDMRDKTTSGNSYFNEDWYQGAAQLVDGKKVENYLMKYDILANELDIKTEEQVKVIPCDWLEEFVLKAPTAAGKEEQLHRFIRFDLFFKPNSSDEGFYELLYEGKKLNLLKQHFTETLQPDYVPALDVGSLTPKVIKKEKYFIFDGEALREVPRSKKKLLELLQPHQELAADYYKQNKPSPKREGELREFVKFCDQGK